MVWARELKIGTFSTLWNRQGRKREIEKSKNGYKDEDDLHDIHNDVQEESERVTITTAVMRAKSLMKKDFPTSS